MRDSNLTPEPDSLPTPDPAPQPCLGQAPYAELLRGEQYYIKRLKPEDVSDIYIGWLNDPEVVRFLQVRFQQRDRDSIKAFVGGFNHIDNFFFGVFAAQDDSYIGNVTLRADPVHLFANMGYLIGAKEYWGGNAALETCRLIADFAFFERGLRKIIDCTTENHIASNFNFRRLGFNYESKIPDLYWSEGKYHAAVYWSMTARKWAEIHGREADAVTP